MSHSGSQSLSGVGKQPTLQTTQGMRPLSEQRETLASERVPHGENVQAEAFGTYSGCTNGTHFAWLWATREDKDIS